MTATNHVITGAAVALLVKQPELAITVAFLSHFAIDGLPHFKVAGGVLERNRKKMFWLVNIVDAILVIALVVLLPPILRMAVPLWLIYVCMLAAFLPDMAWIYRLFFELKTRSVRARNRLNDFHVWVQWKEFEAGIFFEVAWFGLMWLVLIAKA